MFILAYFLSAKILHIPAGMLDAVYFVKPPAQTKYYSILQAFRVSAHVTHVASALMFERRAAFRACFPEHLLLRLVPEDEFFFRPPLVVQIFFHGYSYRVRA
jgi:hypothetical protein